MLLQLSEFWGNKNIIYCVIFQIQILDHLEKEWFKIFYQRICKNISKCLKSLIQDSNSLALIMKIQLYYVGLLLIQRILMEAQENGQYQGYGQKE